MRTEFIPKTVLAGFRVVGLATLLATETAQESAAMMADSRPFTDTQPDGSPVTLHLRGDEFFHWHEDAEGFTVVRDNGWWTYAQLDEQKRLVPTSWRAGTANPENLGFKRRVLPPPELRPLNKNRDLPIKRLWPVRGKPDSSAATPQRRPTVNGEVRNLVILCRFNDHTTGVHTRSRADYDVLFNQVGGDTTLAPTGSVRDAYDENSHQLVTMRSTVLDWIVLPQAEMYYAGTNNGMGSDYPNNAQRMVQDALAAVDPLVNFAQFDANNDGYIDAITFIHSGYATEQTGSPGLIWSHRRDLGADWVSNDNNANSVRVKVNDYHTEAALFGTAGTNITRIGVICHELGHFFGLPDLYDTDNSSPGIADWCMMADAWGVSEDQLRPPHFSAWCKVALGWAGPFNVLVPGEYFVNQTETTSAFAVLKISQGFPPGEYLLVENRQPVGLDSNIPQGGLAVWHIDEKVGDNSTEGFPGQSGWPGNGNHFKVALLQADGRYDLEQNANEGDAGDLWRMGGPAKLGPATVPSTEAYQSGNLRPTFIRLSQFSAPGATMTLRCDFYSRMIFVNKDSPVAPGNGSFDLPYRLVPDAYNAAAAGDGIVFVGGGDYYSAPRTLNKRIGVESWNVVSTIR